MDNPVGAGYSYVESSNLLTTNVSEISADLLTMLEEFYSVYHYSVRINPAFILAHGAYF